VAAEIAPVVGQRPDVFVQPDLALNLTNGVLPAQLTEQLSTTSPDALTMRLRPGHALPSALLAGLLGVLGSPTTQASRSALLRYADSASEADHSVPATTDYGASAHAAGRLGRKPVSPRVVTALLLP
jgi:hypothetical protein